MFMNKEIKFYEGPKCGEEQQKGKNHMEMSMKTTFVGRLRLKN